MTRADHCSSHASASAALPRDVCQPVVGTDGKSIVFMNDREGGRVGNFELFSVAVDGGTKRQLTNRPRYDTDPVFSPDGRRIVFVGNADGNRRYT